MATQAALGQAALKSSNYPAAIKHYTVALTTSPSPIWLIQRSIAYQRNKQYELALADAENAVLAALARGKRELIATAQFRRGVSLHSLGRFGDSRMCFMWCMKSNEKESGLTMWLAKVKKDYEAAGGEEAENNKVTVKEIPDKVDTISQSEEKAAGVVGKIRSGNNEQSSQTTPVAPKQTPKEKIRHEWFQSPSKVTITIFAKGVPKSDAKVNIQDHSLEVDFPIAAWGSSYNFDVSPLFSKIDASQSSFSITPHKLEITLHKATPGLKWPSLEGEEPQAIDINKQASTAPVPSAQSVATASSKAPAYPTSSLKGPRNWDTVADEALKTGTKDDEPEEVDDFFKMLYKNADPDTRRAMVKSYQESNGTHLSTSWADVKKGPVETTPPEGLVAKKWND